MYTYCTDIILWTEPKDEKQVKTKGKGKAKAKAKVELYEEPTSKLWY